MTSTTLTWKPTAEEVNAIVVSMRPLIDRMVARDSRMLRAELGGRPGKVG